MPRILLIGASGYVGSRVASHLSELGWTIVGCDHRECSARGVFSDYIQSPYSALSDAVISDCDVVLWFAGHSSVRIAQDEPWRSVENNVIDLARLFQRAGMARKPVIYASSASVLSSANDQYSLVANEVSSNAYDAGKLAFDILVPHLGAHCLGLRMSTISGWSPNMRWDLVFNAMNRSAALEGVVRVQNASSFRSLLFIDDLCAFIQSAINRHLSDGFLANARQTALGSWSGTIGSLASEIGAFWQVPVEIGPNNGTYSFVVADRALGMAFDSPLSLYQSIGQRCAAFARQNDWTSPQ